MLLQQTAVSHSQYAAAATLALKWVRAYDGGEPNTSVRPANHRNMICESDMEAAHPAHHDAVPEVAGRQALLRRLRLHAVAMPGNSARTPCEGACEADLPYLNSALQASASTCLAGFHDPCGIRVWRLHCWEMTRVSAQNDPGGRRRAVWICQVQHCRTCAPEKATFRCPDAHTREE